MKPMGALLLASFLGLGTLRAGKPAPFTDSFRLEDCTFGDSGRSAYFRLDPDRSRRR